MLKLFFEIMIFNVEWILTDFELIFNVFLIDYCMSLNDVCVIVCNSTRILNDVWMNLEWILNDLLREFGMNFAWWLHEFLHALAPPTRADAHAIKSCEEFHFQFVWGVSFSIGVRSFIFNWCEELHMNWNRN